MRNSRAAQLVRLAQEQAKINKLHEQNRNIFTIEDIETGEVIRGSPDQLYSQFLSPATDTRKSCDTESSYFDLQPSFIQNENFSIASEVICESNSTGVPWNTGGTDEAIIDGCLYDTFPTNDNITSFEPFTSHDNKLDQGHEFDNAPNFREKDESESDYQTDHGNSDDDSDFEYDSDQTHVSATDDSAAEFDDTKTSELINPSESALSTKTDDVYDQEPQLNQNQSIVSSENVLSKSHPELADLNSSFEEYTVEENSSRRKRRRRPDSAAWKRNIAKVRREEGKSYLGYRRVGKTVLQDKEREARKLGPPCFSKECVRRKNRKCSDISEEERVKIFNLFWQEINWDQKRTYVVNHVQLIPKKRNYTNNTVSKRDNTFVYHLTIEREQKEVCKKLFLSTTGLGEFTVHQWVKGKNDGHAMPESQKNRNKKRKNPDRSVVISRIDFSRQFLRSLPKLPSHYQRIDSDKLFLEPVFRKKSNVFDLYVSQCKERGELPISRSKFSTIFDDMNLSIHTLKKDKCDLCVQFEVGQLTKEEHDAHIAKKNRARAEKRADKKKAKEGKCQAFTMDVEAVKVAPFVTASAIYFRTKLCCHNFTIFNLANKDVMCYWFDESQADLTSSTFASCIIDHLSQRCNLQISPIILFSDGCSYQNRNINLSTALSSFAMEKNIEIQQKYLIVGHTQMECDSVHAKIEDRLKGREIFIPYDYISATREARKLPNQYEVKKVVFSDIKDFSIKKYQRYSSIRPGKATNDPTVADLRAIRYLPDGRIEYKLDFDDEWELLPQREKKKVERKKLAEWPQLHNEELRIPKSKWTHLQHLKSVIPTEYHNFYDNLKCGNACDDQADDD